MLSSLVEHSPDWQVLGARQEGSARVHTGMANSYNIYAVEKTEKMAENGRSRAT